ncbi:MAG TPA: hypothetical protein VEJ63_00025, partial [Planctomycetota bacterium]|nr:hypothetical protein [Planctomycetota bacterium]
VHLDLVRERPEWARNLEHLPGVNLRWRELGCEFWFPEFRQWTFYFGELERLNAARKYIASRPWSSEDDLFHWKKLAAYYGPYDRSIDAPINLGPYENKYPLHSRIMHYFAPAVQSAVALMEQRCGAGKIDALKRARELFPHAEVIDDVLRIIDLHYECPDELSPRGLDLLDARLEEYLARATEVLLHARPLDGCSAKPTRAELSRAVARLQRGDSANSVFENVRFARLMKGRLWFYSQDVLWFDSLPLIRNELNRIHKNFFEAPVTIAARLLCRENSNALAALDTLTGSILTRAEADACREFAELAGAPCENRDLKQRAAEIADCFEPFLTAIESLLEALAKRKAEQQSAQNWPRRGSECQKSHVNTAG